MTSIKDFTAKKMQLWFAGGALFMYLVYMGISMFTGLSDTPIFSDFWNMKLLNRAILLLPHLVFFGAAIVSNKLKGNIRYIPYVLVGMELFLSFLCRCRLVNYHPVGIFEGAGWGSYGIVCSIIYTLILIAFITMPFAKKPVLITCASAVMALYMLAMGLEIYYDIAYYDWGFQLDVVFKFLAAILYQSSFICFAFEMTTDNRIHVYSRIFDFFIGLDFLDDDFSELIEEISEELNDSEKKHYLNAYEENEALFDENTCRARWINSFDDLTIKTFDVIEIAGSDFLLDPLEESSIVYQIEHTDDGTISVSGEFVHSFSDLQAARILRKKSVLNQTFKDIELEAKADTNIGVDSIEEGDFSIRLKKKNFVISDDDYNTVREYMIRFLETVIVIQNTESIE